MAACEARLVALIDSASGELPEPERRELEQHLAACVGCRAELAELRQTEQLLLSTVQTPDDLHLSGFAFRVADRAEAFRDRSARGLWWSFTRAMRVTMAASGMAVTASAMLFMLSRHPIEVAPGLTTASADVSSEAGESSLSDVVQLVAEQRDVPDVSLDSALDALSPDELDALSQQLAANSG